MSRRPNGERPNGGAHSAAPICHGPRYAGMFLKLGERYRMSEGCQKRIWHIIRLTERMGSVKAWLNIFCGWGVEFNVPYSPYTSSAQHSTQAGHNRHIAPLTMTLKWIECSHRYVNWSFSCLWILFIVAFQSHPYRHYKAYVKLVIK